MFANEHPRPKMNMSANDTAPLVDKDQIGLCEPSPAAVCIFCIGVCLEGGRLDGRIDILLARADQSQGGGWVWLAAP